MTQPVPHTQPLIIGITGTIGSGKSLVGTILKEEGVPVVDTDAVVHLLLDNDPGVQANIEKRFGTTVLKVDELGKTVVDRRALGHVVFNDDIARRDLERIVHPAVLEYCQDWIASQGEPLVPCSFRCSLKLDCRGITIRSGRLSVMSRFCEAASKQEIISATTKSISDCRLN